MKLLSWMLDAGFGGNFLQKQAWHHLFRPKSDSWSQNLPLESAWTRKFEWNSTKRIRWTHSKWGPEMVPNTGKRTKPQFLKMTRITTWMIFREILSLPFAAFWSNFFIPFPAKYIPILRGGHSKCDVWRVPHHWEMGKTWQTKCFERKFGGCIFSVWDVYWCSQNQTWTSRAGSRTPSLDSKMCQFPGISLSELWKVRSFRLIPVNNRPKNEAFELDAGFRLWRQFLSKTSLASFVQAKSDSLSQNLLLENDRARKCEWNSTKR